MKKILFVHPYFGNGGAEKGILTLARELKFNNINCSLACSDYTNTTNSNQVFFDVIMLPNISTLSMILPVFKHVSRYYYDWIIINQAFAISAFVFPLKVFNLFYFFCQISVYCVFRAS